MENLWSTVGFLAATDLGLAIGRPSLHAKLGGMYQFLLFSLFAHFAGWYMAAMEIETMMSSSNGDWLTITAKVRDFGWHMCSGLFVLGCVHAIIYFVADISLRDLNKNKATNDADRDIDKRF